MAERIQDVANSWNLAWTRVDGGLGCRGLNELKRASGYIVLRIHMKSPFNTTPVGNTK